MLQVLIVDDERIIREGLGKGFDWGAHGYAVCGLAANGTQALDMIRQYRPELVMLDIRMPDMDGLELIARSQAHGLRSHFVILSGYSEFEYAKRAMYLGVQYYLTKPCKDTELAATVEAVRTAVCNERERDSLIQDTIRDHGNSLSQIQEQIIRQAVAGEKATVDKNAGWILSELDQLNLRLMLLRPSAAADTQARRELRDRIAAYPKSAAYSHCILFGTDLVWVVSAMPVRETNEMIRAILRTGDGRFFGSVDRSVSSAGHFRFLHEMYQQSLTALDFQLRMEEETTDGVTRPVFYPLGRETIAARAVLRRVYTDSFRKIREILEGLFEPACPDGLHRFTGVCLSICLNTAFDWDPEGAFAGMERLGRFHALRTAGQVLLQTETFLLEIAARSPDPGMKDYSPATQKAVQYIEGHLGNADISLSYLARNVLFMHEDYIGKLFTKDTGVKFTQYIRVRRILAAVDIFRTQPDVRIFEVCKKVGFGSNTQYFSRVFKDMTDYTPSEFLKLP